MTTNNKSYRHDYFHDFTPHQSLTPNPTRKLRKMNTPITVQDEGKQRRTVGANASPDLRSTAEPLTNPADRHWVNVAAYNQAASAEVLQGFLEQEGFESRVHVTQPATILVLDDAPSWDSCASAESVFRAGYRMFRERFQGTGVPPTGDPLSFLQFIAGPISADDPQIHLPHVDRSVAGAVPDHETGVLLRSLSQHLGADPDP